MASTIIGPNGRELNIPICGCGYLQSDADGGAYHRPSAECNNPIPEPFEDPEEDPNDGAWVL